MLLCMDVKGMMSEKQISGKPERCTEETREKKETSNILLLENNFKDPVRISEEGKLPEHHRIQAHSQSPDVRLIAVVAVT